MSAEAAHGVQRGVGVVAGGARPERNARKVEQ